MGKNNYTKANKFADCILGILIIGVSVLFLQWKQERPVEIKDDSRIQVHMNFDVLKNALKERASDWGTYATEWSPLNGMEESNLFVIESAPGQKFYNILRRDSAAYQLARDYPYLFAMEDLEDGSCRFEMACDKGNYVVFPTWLLVELIERKVLILNK